MKRSLLIFTLFIIIGCAVLLSACGKKDPDQQSALQQMQKAAEQSQQTAQDMQKSMNSDKKPVPPVSFKVLIEFLPKAVEGLTPGTPDGETTTMNEWSYAFAKNRYESKDGNSDASVEIFDYAYISLLYAPYQILWNMNYSRETAKGYERSIKIADSPAFAKWDEESKSSEVSILVGERFIVKCETHGLQDGVAKKIVEGIDMKKLAVQKAN
jgi:hypothetical protein